MSDFLFQLTQTLGKTRPIIVVIASIILLSACTDRSTTFSDDEIALNNKGVALMGRFDYRGAAQVFEELVQQQPKWHDARTNLAIALKNRQEAGDGEKALAQLDTVLEAQPDNVRAHYVAGVLQLYLGNVESATRYFETALKLDPNDAYTHYYLGQCQLRSGDQEAALASYKESIKLDPYLRSAYYSAAQVQRRIGLAEEANKNIEIFQRFENNPNARLAEFKYSRMGPKSLAQVVGNQADVEPSNSQPEGSLFSPQAVVADVSDLNLNYQISTVDYNADGAQDLLLVNPDSESRLLISDGDGFVEQAEQPWKTVTNINAVAWGDVDNDGLVDAYLCRTGANQLWMQTQSSGWQLSDADVGDGGHHCTDAALVDADHDGDLDILVANRGAKNNLLNNNRDSSFRSLANKLGGKTANTKHLIVTDIDSDSDADIVFVNELPPHQVLINDRLWDYTTSPQLNDLISADVSALAAFDLNADGQVELISLDDNGAINVWERPMSGAWTAKPILSIQSKIIEGVTNLAPVDVSGDGQAELLVLASQAFQVIKIRQDASNQWIAETVLAEQYQGGAAVPVTRSLNGSSLIAVNEDSKVIEWAPGNGRFQFVTLELSGKHDAAETMRSNHSGIGSRVSLRNGSRWSVADTFKHSSLRGYSLQPLSIGLAGSEKADFVAVDWSDGVYQTELDLANDSIQQIGEEQRQLGSCPVLFAWNGEKYDFVTDILGVGAQGFLVEPGVLLPPRPWERITFAPNSVVAHDGSIKFKVTEPMEENSYIDAMTLESYDVPDGWNLVVDERMGTAPPAVTGNVMFYQKSVSPTSAYNRDGEDVRADILKHDQVAMDPGAIDRRFIGLLEEPQSLTIEFDSPLKQGDSVPVLVAESWVELPYSQTHFSAWQAGRAFRSVSLEARDANGEWLSVHPEFGIPGGMPRTISLPLEAIPDGSEALRLSWNRQIYWDRVRVVYAEQPPAEVVKATVSPNIARVAKSGFYKRLNHAQRRPEYVYQDRKTFGDVKYPTGFYTSLGEMTELVSSSDDALAIIGPGEEIHVEFNLPESPREGTKRWYVLDVRGWAKDKDLYTHTGNAVEPLPRTYPDISSDARDRLHAKYNTRFQSGR